MKTVVEATVEARIKKFRDDALLMRSIISSLCKISDSIEKAHRQGSETVYDDLIKEALKEFSKLVESFLRDKNFLDKETTKVFSTFIVYVEAYLATNK